MTGPQVDLFLDQLVDASIKDEQRLMEFPFFALQKQPRRQRFIYDDGVVKIEIAAARKRRARMTSSPQRRRFTPRGLKPPGVPLPSGVEPASIVCL